MDDLQIVDLTRNTDYDRDAVLALYRLSGWYPEEELIPLFFERLIRGSFSFMAVYLNHDLVGAGRAISDGVSDAYVQDIFVDPACQKMGIGSLIVRNLVNTLHNAGITWIGLIGVPGSEAFYRKLGFEVMPGFIPMLKGE